jgi:biofilm PGA synthesis N-glycosyltransferase PgaC
MKILEYVLVTPARNEEEFIEKTILSVIGQTVQPKLWVIVSDGSTDQTDAIVQRHALNHRWIKLLRLQPRASRNFGGKATAFNEGLNCARTQVQGGMDLIGCLDGDLSFGESGIFEFLIRKFREDEGLGIAGVPYEENGRTYDYTFSDTRHVSGSCPLFRAQSLQDSGGGYQAIRVGGIDTLAVLEARVRGWRTETFVENGMVMLHHRPMGFANDRSRAVARFKNGKVDYLFGNAWYWQFCRSVYQIRFTSLIDGSMLLFGFFWAMLTQKRIVRNEIVEMVHAEQRARLLRRLPFFKG